MPNHRGGIAAIGGFLFQVMVAAGMRAATEIFDRARDGSDLQALITLAGETDIFTEAFDQDIALKESAERGRSGLTLVQVKYSMNEASIGPAEMETDIYPAFVRACDAARDVGEPCTSLSLITNRPVSPNLQNNLTAANRRFLADLNFKVYPGYGFDLWRGYLSAFCRGYGWSADEINTKIDALLGHILHETHLSGGGFKLEKDYFLVALAGNRLARPLSRKNANEIGLWELDQFGDRASGEAVRREILKQAEEDTENRALIVFEGLGGAGKTASLIKWASSIAELDDPEAPIISLQGADGARNPWLLEFTAQLNPALGPATDAQAIVRFATANPANHGVLFHLSMDGIDDLYPTNEARAAVVGLLRHYMKADEMARKQGGTPQSRLVVTCRSFENVCKNLLRLPRRATNGGGYDDRALCLPFGFFSDAELQDLIKLNCRKLLPHIFPPRVTFGGATVFGDFSYGGDTEHKADTAYELKGMDDVSVAASPKKNYARILSDPVMWASFMVLGEEDREAWVKGNDAFEMRMAELYVNRFALKAHLRLGLAEDILVLALREIARANFDDATFKTRVDWTTWATTSRLLDDIAAGRLYEEAMSGGLVTWNAELRWQWRNPLIATFLRAEVGP